MFQKRSKKISENRLAILAGAGVVALAIVFALGILVGRQTPKNVVLEDGSVIGIGEFNQIESDVHFSQFWEVWRLLQEDYIYGPVSDKDLFYGAIAGLVEGLDDPYSVFFDPEEADEFQTDLNGSFEGIGAEIGLRDGQVVIVSPLTGSPAEQAGVKAGDAIHLVDDIETFGMSIEEAVRVIRGPKGTTVTLTVTRDTEDGIIEIPIKRDTIEISSVEWEIRDDGIAVIDIFAFNDDTSRNFNRAVVDVLTADVEGLVVDMRNNPGGFLDRAVTVAGEWVGNDTVVIERMGSGLMRDLDAQGVARLANIPTVVIVNGGSASATEIVAGALQDYGLASIVGEQTFGKGSVQEYRELSDGSGLKITIAEWLTPQGRSIQKEGIKPDYIVEFTEEDILEERDVQFEKAIELLTSN